MENSHQSVSGYAPFDTLNGALIQRGKWESLSPSQAMRKLTSRNSPITEDLGSLSIEAIIVRSIEQNRRVEALRMALSLSLSLLNSLLDF